MWIHKIRTYRYEATFTHLRKKYDEHMAINKNKLIEARWKNIHKPEPDKEIK